MYWNTFRNCSVTDFIRYVQDESRVVVKAAIISGAGLTGVALGFRGNLVCGFYLIVVESDNSRGSCFI